VCAQRSGRSEIVAVLNSDGSGYIAGPSGAFKKVLNQNPEAGNKGGVADASEHIIFEIPT